VQEVKSKRSIGIHFGTFPLGDESADAPADDLAAARKAADMPAEEFVTMQHGGMLQTADGSDDANAPPLLPVSL
jgi:N-acyl-phosphatidylethanolamine-hydrolysing phospholipase D